GLVFDALDRTLRLAGQSALPPAARPPEESAPAAPPTAHQTTAQPRPDRHLKKIRRPRTLEREEHLAEARRQAEDQPLPGAPGGQPGGVATSGSREMGTFTVADIVGVAVYLVRASPGIVQGGQAPRECPRGDCERDRATVAG